MTWLKWVICYGIHNCFNPFIIKRNLCWDKLFLKVLHPTLKHLICNGVTAKRSLNHKTCEMLGMAIQFSKEYGFCKQTEKHINMDKLRY